LICGKHFRFSCLGYITIAVISITGIIYSDWFSIGIIALCISSILECAGTMQWFFEILTITTARLTSVEKIISYQQLPPEIDNGTLVLPSWPQRGTIDFIDVNLKYDDGPPVLKNLSFSIKHKEKIGICGRTGAGKSSLIAALFRLTELSHGQILIDDVNISQIPLINMRRKLAIIPQDPVLFCGTIRSNLDPESIYDDGIIWETLDKIHLKEFVSQSSEKLDTLVSENGQNLSVGQRQLICLGRALLKKNNKKCFHFNNG